MTFAIERITLANTRVIQNPHLRGECEQMLTDTPEIRLVYTAFRARGHRIDTEQINCVDLERAVVAAGGKDALPHWGTFVKGKWTPDCGPVQLGLWGDAINKSGRIAIAATELADLPSLQREPEEPICDGPAPVEVLRRAAKGEL